MYTTAPFVVRLGSAKDLWWFVFRRHTLPALVNIRSFSWKDKWTAAILTLHKWYWNGSLQSWNNIGFFQTVFGWTRDSKAKLSRTQSWRLHLRIHSPMNQSVYLELSWTPERTYQFSTPFPASSKGKCSHPLSSLCQWHCGQWGNIASNYLYHLDRLIRYLLRQYATALETLHVRRTDGRVIWDSVPVVWDEW